MPRKSTTDRLYTLRQKREQLDAQLRALEARNKQAERKADTRRKVIAGALGTLRENPDSEFRRILRRLLDEYVVRPHDRALFPELVEADAGSAQRGADARTGFTHAGREIDSPSPTL
jgi:chromosome segregation ATPase